MLFFPPSFSKGCQFDNTQYIKTFGFFSIETAYFEFKTIEYTMPSGADLRGGGAYAPSSGIRPPADPKGPPFDTFSEIHFCRPTLKFFQRRLWRQYILTLRGSARQKKPDFFVKIFQKKRPF